MISPRHLFVVLLVPVVFTACHAFEHVDSRNPTISQQDAYDVSWGLAPRKSRGTPKMHYQYDARRELPQVSAPQAPAAPAPAPAPVSAPAPGPTPTVQKAIPSSLR